MAQVTETEEETRALDVIVRSIVETVDPDKVILFGSRARGDARPDSDFDILIIAPAPETTGPRTVSVYHAVPAVGFGKDIVWWAQEEANDWRNVKSHFITTALREGKVLYERAD